MPQPVKEQIATIADSFLSTPPVPHQSVDFGSMRQEFLNGFLEGFTHPGAQMSTPNNAVFYGFLAGQDFRGMYSAEKEVMEAFGYALVSIKGRLFFGQDAGFTPDSDPGVRWAVADPLLADEGWPVRADREDGMPVMLSGYLTPERYHGARFAGDRKIYVSKTKILGR